MKRKQKNSCFYCLPLKYLFPHQLGAKDRQKARRLPKTICFYGSRKQLFLKTSVSENICYESYHLFGKTTVLENRWKQLLWVIPSVLENSCLCHMVCAAPPSFPLPPQGREGEGLFEKQRLWVIRRNSWSPLSRYSFYAHKSRARNLLSIQSCIPLEVKYSTLLWNRNHGRSSESE